MSYFVDFERKRYDFVALGIDEILDDWKFLCIMNILILKKTVLRLLRSRSVIDGWLVDWFLTSG